MPSISEYKCDMCEFFLPRGWGGYMYVIDKHGERIVCPHPLEYHVVERILKESNPEIIPEWKSHYWLTYGIRIKFRILKSKILHQTEPLNIRKLIKERTGFDEYVVCHNCLDQFKLDLKRDQRICSRCDSTHISTAREIIGKPCPQCNKGKITEKRVGIS